MSDGWLRLTQASIFIGTVFGMIWLSEQLPEPIPGTGIAGTAFCAAYGFTLAHYYLVLWLDRRRAVRARYREERDRRRNPNRSLPASASELAELFASTRVHDEPRDLIDITPDIPALDRLKSLPRPRE